MTLQPSDFESPGDAITAMLLEPFSLTVSQLADAIDVPQNRIYLILNHKRELTVDTACRLGKFSGTGPEFWLFLQMNYNLNRYKDDWALIEPSIHSVESVVTV